MPKKARRERRQHVVYLTKNTEYHCRDRECVGVRDRSSGHWHREHPALRGRLMGALQQGAPTLHRPREGMRLVFNGSQMVMTTRMLLAGRPDKPAIFSYTSLCRSGEIMVA
jgi:hypothetical protein